MLKLSNKSFSQVVLLTAMEYHREEDVEGDESPNDTEENTSASSEDQKESLPGDSAIKLETENQKNEVKKSSNQRLLDWLRVTGRQTNKIIQTFTTNNVSRENDLALDCSLCWLSILCCCCHALP